MSTLGVIGCILGFLIVIYLCYKDWSVYLATFAGACVVIACNTLPFIDSLVGDYVSGMFTAVKSFFFMILFGCLQSKIYTESGAAYTIADTVMNHLLKENMSNTGKNLIGMSVILVIGTILNLGGIIAGVVIVLMYPIARGAAISRSSSFWAREWIAFADRAAARIRHGRARACSARRPMWHWCPVSWARRRRSPRSSSS